MPVQDVTRVVFLGQSPEEVQGVNLREGIQKFAEGPFSVKGQVRNLKHDGSVEIILQGSLELNRLFIEAIKDRLIPKLTDPDCVLTTCTEERRTLDLDGKRKIQVIREDDATETVWALKGAGRIFAKIAKKLDDFAQRDQRKKYALLTAFETELSSNLLLMPENSEEGAICLSNKVLTAILNNMESFTQEESELVKAIATMAHSINVYNRYVEATGDERAAMRNLSEFSQMRVEMRERMNKLRTSVEKQKTTLKKEVKT